MKKLQFLLLVCILTFAVSCGQQKRYVSYKTQEGETMRDIADRLDMKTKDLLRLNPDVGRRPDANTVIVIPNPKIKKGTSSSTTSSEEEVNTTDTNNNEETTPETKEDGTVFQQTIVEYETHEVQKGETVYRITKQYDITKEDLIKFNPEYTNIQSNNLSIGQVLKVKAIEKTVTINKDEVLEKFLTHTVKSKETMYSLTRFYNVTKEDLLRLNPEYPDLADNKLSIGQLLKIKPIEEVSKKENYTFYKDSIEVDTSINLAILLPFKANEYSSKSSKDIFEGNQLANMVTDFYMGAEMAIDSIKKQGVLVNVNIFDTGNRGKNIATILKDKKLENTDVIIGPFYSDKAEVVARDVNAPVVFPHYSSKQSKFTSSKLVKTSPEKENYAGYLASYLKDSYKDQEIFIVSDEEKDTNAKVSKIISELKKHDSINTIHVLKPEKGYIKRARFTSKMSSKRHNWVIITSDDNVVVADALNSMIGIPDEVKVQVFTLEKGPAYDKIDNNKLASVNFTYVSNTYTDEEAIDTKAFNNKYLQKNNTIPSDYAIKGFDITYDVLMRLASGDKLTDTFKKGVSLRVENKFDYHKKTFGSSGNQGLFIVKYNGDLSLSRLR
ncbi:amino acid/amide ABC transporter substrate-binding protein (HAAT family) [Tenacibaculum gallaicum]|uniref:Amino acid/amide ABC transporter substrate-binding protein (HAAT family) n=1 Tax=Tenacibaculum gallaicum TaxID=561505 RepID=A0A3E0HIB1_9FLAO|nr:LysM peptidoglycan-binding domain-containing protein [Tenacibaculum gallaicum]REH45785.1 amino acid/amide ABC transporter substrate-binding protein (HAAT family) [Tenacibaculum gallaicum]